MGQPHNLDRQMSDRDTVDRPRALTRRSFLKIAGGGAALALLTACAPSAPSAPSGGAVGPATKTGPTGVKLAELGRDYLAYPDVKGNVVFSNCWGAARIPLVEGWIKDFNAIYPGITVENDVIDCPPLQQKQVTAIAGGSPPNMLMIKSDNTAFFADQGSIIPLDDLMKRDEVKADWFYPGEFASRTWQGKTYGLPNVTAGSLHLLYVNTKLLQQVGWDPKKPVETWQDLDSLVEPAKKAGLLVMDPGKVSTGQTMHFVMTYANGGRYWNDELTKVLWNEPAAVEAAEWQLQFVKSQAGKYENLAIATDRKNAIQSEAWAAEKYLAMINLSSSFFRLGKSSPHVQYVTYTFPRNGKNAESKGNTPSTGGWMFSIAKAGQDQAAAWEWIKFTTTSKFACGFVKAQDRPSPAIACNEDPELAKKNPFWPVVTKDLAQGVSVPTSTIHPQFIQLWYEMEDAILLERMAPKQALDSFAARGQTMLDEWNAKRKQG